MTTLTLNLDSTLQGVLSSGTPGSNGIWAYAFVTNGSSVTYTTLVDNGTVLSSSGEPTGTFLINLPQIEGGKVYFIIQSQDAADTNDLTTLITSQSQITWQNAQAWDFRYDSFEYTLQNATGDAGNLTSVEGFGLPMDLSVTYANGTTKTSGYATNGWGIINDIVAINGAAISNYTEGVLANTPRMGISPSQAVTTGSTVFQPSDWTAYINAVKTPATPIVISGMFNGAADVNGVWHNGGYFSYQLSWDATAANSDGTTGAFWLSPTANSQIQGYIKITQTDLANSIYSTLGNAEVYATLTSAPYQIAGSTSTEMNTGANNQWGEVFTQFLTGFTAGYFGTTGASTNSSASQAINLNTNINWDPTYAFGQHLSSAQPVFMDAYSKIFFENSNSYGSSYSDNLMSQYTQGGPQIILYDTTTNLNVSNINLTLYDDSVVPAGYTTPVIYNYINPSVVTVTNPGGAGFQVPVQNSANANIVLNFANGHTILNEATTAVTLKIYAGEQSGAPVWIPVTFPVIGYNQTLWQSWSLVYDSTTNTYSAVAAGGSQPVGSMLIQGLPTSNSGVTWYQIVLQASDDPTASLPSAKTFNIYTTTSGYQFLDPDYSSAQSGAIAVDGLAVLQIPQYPTTPQTINTFSINFLPGSSSTIDDSLLTWYQGTLATPSSPVIGDMSSGAFASVTGQSLLNGSAVSTGSGELGFGWTGFNPVAWSSAWVGAYSNKTAALDVAYLRFGGTSIAPTSAVGDIDGQWASGMVQFGNGTYTVNVQEYRPGGITSANAVTVQSANATFTVDVATLALKAGANGQALLVDTSSHPEVSGNWIRFEAQTPSPGLPRDATLVLYVTDAAGNLLARDGRTGSVTLAEATLAKIGAVYDDAGVALLQGGQQLYLGAGEQLHFAVLSGSGAVDMAPAVHVSTAADGSATVAVGGFTLAAVTNNVLSDAAELASTQRMNDQPLVYLTHGAALDVQVTGSSSNTNALGFVHIDVDPTSGAWSVDGVAYGDTAAFKAAVASHLDAGLNVSRGGQTAMDVTWTVAGTEGYYAPVLLTQNGDIFVVGQANAGGHEYIRMYGENTFGFEDLTAAQGSDFDYNDMVMKITPLHDIF
ncbi:DUF4114 domain-containing protein [Azorhizobium doebereinerae]|uniref:DUF4114 domain-containing protein n=1 Tax=Azorhizobium doebereinerae TaxID=281091 RepID=UPI0003F50E0C|nr:DUF4114 domain-containing protein [Azorhizobium doebereinerae]